MDDHQNARLTVHSREQLARKVLAEGCTLTLAAASFNVSAKIAAIGQFQDALPLGAFGFSQIHVIQ